MARGRKKKTPGRAGPGQESGRGKQRPRSRRHFGQLSRNSGSKVSKPRARPVEFGLVSFVQEMYEYLFGAGKDGLEPFRLSLEFTVEPAPGAWKLSGKSLASQVTTSLQDMAAKKSVLRQGRVFCYKCMSSSCEHSSPKEPSWVFAGYTPTGRPRWQAFSQMLLDRGHDRVDELFFEKPSILSCMIAGRELHELQMNAFGRMRRDYIVLAQLAAGYFDFFGPFPGTAEKAAITFQVVEASGRNGKRTLDINVITASLNGVPVLDLLEAKLYRLQGHITRTRDRARSLLLEAKYRMDRNLAAEAAGEILMDLARGLERMGRQRKRRTKHAEDRAGHRPVTKALQEALAADDASILWDDRKQTMVVLGARHRAHVFTTQGRLVTTMVIQQDAVERRLKRGRWTRPDPETVKNFKQGLKTWSKS